MLCSKEGDKKLAKWLAKVFWPLSWYLSFRTGDPVNVVTGAFEHTDEDLLIPTQRLFLRLARHYSNQEHETAAEPRLQPFGPGWSHSLAQRLECKAQANGTEDSDKEVTFIDEKGSRLIFVHNENTGDYSAPPGGLGMTLSRLSNGGFNLRQIDGLTAVFLPDGRIEALLRPGPSADSRIDFDYDEKKRLTAARGAGGRCVRLNYGNDYLVRSVEDHTGRRWEYRYNDQGELEAVLDPAGRIRRYAYAGWEKRISTGKKTCESKATRALTQVFAFRYARDQSPEVAEITNTYTTERRVHCQKDAEGGQTRFRYNPFAGTTEVTDAAGYTTVYAADTTRGMTTKVRTPGGGVTEYIFDRRCNLIADINPLGARTEYVDFKNPSILDRARECGQRTLGNRSGYLAISDEEIVLGYDEQGNRPLVRNALGEATRFENYSPFGKPGRVILPDGSRVENHYDSRSGLLLRQERLLIIGRDIPLKRIEAWDYDALGNVLRHRIWAESLEAKSASPTLVEEFAYDPHGHHPILKREWIGGEQAHDFAAEGRHEWNSLGQRTSTTIVYLTEPGGPAQHHTFHYGYDALNRQVWELAPTGAATCVRYDASGRILERYTIPNANPESLAALPETSKRSRWCYQYDRMGRLRIARDPTGIKVEQEWDKRGLCVASSDAGGLRTVYAYNRERHLILETHPTRGEVKRTYDACGRAVAERHKAGLGIEREFDGLGRMVCAKRTLEGKPAGESRYEYDIAGRLCKAVFPDGTYEQLRYDELGKTVLCEKGTGTEAPAAIEVRRYNGIGRISEIWHGSPAHLRKLFTYEYDESRRVICIYDALGNARKEMFDTRGLLVCTMDAEGLKVHYEADAAGRLVRRIAADQSGDVRFEYDPLGRIIRAAEAGISEEWDYDEAGRITRHTQNVLGQIKHLLFKYDWAGREVKREIDSDWWRHIEYGKNGQPTRLSFPGAAAILIWDTDGKLVEEKWDNGIVRRISYEPDGLVRSLEYLNPSGGIIFSQKTERDQRRRPVSETKIWEDDVAFYEYSYDSLDRLGRVKCFRQGVQSVDCAYTYDDWSNRVSEARNGTHSWQYRYDAADRLVERESNTGAVERFTHDRNGNLTSKEGVRFGYDAFQRLRTVTFADEPEGSAAYDYNGQGRVAVERKSGRAIQWYWAGSSQALVLELDKKQLFFWALGDRRLVLRREDNSGIAQAFTDPDLSVVFASPGHRVNRFGAFGEIGNVQESSVAFQGKWFDRDSGLYQNGARWVDPQTGRFTQPDFKGCVDGCNLYSYAKNNPVCYSDVLGYTVEHSSQGAIVSANAEERNTETFYRTMTEEHYKELLATSTLPASPNETMISPSLEYAQNYTGVTVSFNVLSGTTESLLDIGVRSRNLTNEPYASLPIVEKGWKETSAFFKLEEGVVNIGLGRGAALDIFNHNILQFNFVSRQNDT